MIHDIDEKVKEVLPKYKNLAEEKAEYYAEVYVSSTMGIDDEEVKQTIKLQYKEMFMDKLSTLIHI